MTTDEKSRCERCEATDEPLRDIKVGPDREDRERLCEDCFEKGLKAGDVHQTDPRHPQYTMRR